MFVLKGMPSNELTRLTLSSEELRSFNETLNTILNCIQVFSNL